jgi:ribonucleoside-diphosphate reductase alpha chain
LKAQGIQTEIITNFIDFVESGRLRLLIPSSKLEIPDKIKNDRDKAMIKAAHFQTDQLIDQIANLKLVQKSGGKLQVEPVTKKTDKDIWSAVAYLLYYLKEYEDKKIEENTTDANRFLFFN